MKKLSISILLLVLTSCATTEIRSNVSFASVSSISPVYYYDSVDSNSVDIDN